MTNNLFERVIADLEKRELEKMVVAVEEKDYEKKLEIADNMMMLARFK